MKDDQLLEGYILSNRIAPKFNSELFYVYANKDAKVYTSQYLKIEEEDINIKYGNMLDVVYITQDHACILVNDKTVFIKLEDIDVVLKEDLRKTNETQEDLLFKNWEEVNAYHYVTKDAYLFNEESFDTPNELIEAFQKVYVIKISENWAYVRTDDGKEGFMEPYLLFKLPDTVFVDVDITDQQTRIIENQQIVFSTPCVTGADETPSDIGYFDIDDKVRNTYLRAYNDDNTLKYCTYVDYWMPYNYGEGLHDAPWQNGHFGDTNWYHVGGSHGCLNQPPEAAPIIWDYVDVGTMVLVHK